MSESDTMFNERDRRCAAVQLMLSPDPSYDNRTIASILKMQIRTVQRLRAQLNASDDPLEVVDRKDTARKTRTKEFTEKVQAIIDETPQQPIGQIARDLGISHTSVNACVKEDLKCRSYRHQTSQILTEKTKCYILTFDPAPKMLFLGNTPEGSDTFQRPVIERDRVGGLRLMIWEKVKVPFCHYSHAPEESNLWTAWQLFPLDDD